MTALALRTERPAPDLPPAFSWAAPPPGIPVHDFARDAAARLGAGSLTSRTGDRVLEFAVVLEPEERLRDARRSALVGMAALADAVGSAAPPEMPVAIRYPDVIEFDGARLGGGRLAWPESCGEEDVPDWLVFSAMLIASKRHAGDPGLTPDSTALDEEGFGPGAPDAIVEAFARYLLLGFDAVRDRGFAAWSDAYRRWMRDARTAWLDADGNLRTGTGEVVRLAQALADASWFDPGTGAPRL
ncbi:biotin/lipoate--protein ligase family protein [Enterovirga aerilata]|uniref:BPL/LPL catalytic domain-containing protein n=1 Tax=Enterovirga aerilata TaxID=2730920 RepID=A0A849IBM7_9HYPH|nr:biotin/lipoate--protein ligase family protein [Enterovirga sp. DB1703]NNM74808.1 hypothetical protein [Enterovirga sp. DB1703]